MSLNLPGDAVLGLGVVVELEIKTGTPVDVIVVEVADVVGGLDVDGDSVILLLVLIVAVEPIDTNKEVVVKQVPVQFS